MTDSTSDPGYDPYNSSTRLPRLSLDFTPDEEARARSDALRILAATYRAEGKFALAAIVEQEAA